MISSEPLISSAKPQLTAMMILPVSLSSPSTVFPRVAFFERPRLKLTIFRFCESSSIYHGPIQCAE
jgi:hypothetical protein